MYRFDSDDPSKKDMSRIIAIRRRKLEYNNDEKPCYIHH